MSRFTKSAAVTVTPVPGSQLLLMSLTTSSNRVTLPPLASNATLLMMV